MLVGAAYDEAQTAIYRLLFLLFAEARALVPTWHPLYRDAYTLESTCASWPSAARGQMPSGLPFRRSGGSLITGVTRAT